MASELAEMAASDPSVRKRLLPRGLRLEYTTLVWNVVGVFVLAIAAISASSVALASFGLDSLIEIGAFTVAAYIAIQATYLLVLGDHPHTSYLGIAWAALSFIAMLALAYGKARTGEAIDNAVLRTEGRVTLVDAYLAAAVLLSLILNVAAGWWWADPAAGYVIVVYGIKEGRGALIEARAH